MSYNKLLYHIVFRPKNNTPAIPELYEKELYNYIWGFVKNKNCVLHRIGGMPDHIQILVQLPTTISLADFMRELKTSTNKWLQCHSDKFPFFGGWARSYCAITCSYEVKDTVAEYIAGQKSHHGKINFMEELRAIFRENCIADSVENFVAEP